jgi:maltooligosyltrehalose trehalohydrolase
MGQEWAASTPFLYFTDHHAELGRLVTAGRRDEFRHFLAFSNSETRARIPDPQAEATFLASRLVWDERLREPHASTLRLYRALLALRQREPALRNSSAFQVEALDEATVAMRRDRGRDSVLIVARLKGAGDVALASHGRAAGASVWDPAPGHWQVVMTSEDPAFAPEPAPPDADCTRPAPTIRFVRPSAVVLRRGSEGKPS